MPFGKICDATEDPAPRFFIQPLGNGLWEGGMEQWTPCVGEGYDCLDFVTGLPLPELIERLRGFYEEQRRFHE